MAGRLRSLAPGALGVLGVLGFALACAGCASPLDMTRAYHPERPALTVVYTGVREETRLYPDYNPIGASILTEPGKKGK